MNFGRENNSSSSTSIRESKLEPNATIKFYHLHNRGEMLWIGGKRLSQM